MNGDVKPRPQKNSVVQALRWLNDEAATDAWIERSQIDLKQALNKGNGFAKIDEFLPHDVANGIRQFLEGHPEEEWERAGSGDHDDANYADHVNHGFSILDCEPHAALLGVARLLGKLMPGTLPNFSAARYNQRDHIAPHDDLVPECYTAAEVQRLLQAHHSNGDLESISNSWREEASAVASHMGESADVQLEAALQAGDLEAVKRAVEAGARASAVGKADEREIPYTRIVAMAYYLTRDWKCEYGGEFVDLETKVHHKPDFNTMVVFNVPRMHEVTAVRAPPGVLRHSIFGWWLVEAKPSARKMPVASRGLQAAAIKKRPAAADSATCNRKRPASSSKR